jgi:hypothetical protein
VMVFFIICDAQTVKKDFLTFDMYIRIGHIQIHI